MSGSDKRPDDGGPASESTLWDYYAATWIEATKCRTFRWDVVSQEKDAHIRRPCFTLREAKQVAEDRYGASGKWERMVDLSGKVIYQDTKGL